MNHALIFINCTTPDHPEVQQIRTGFGDRVCSYSESSDKTEFLLSVTGENNFFDELKDLVRSHPKLHIYGYYGALGHDAKTAFGVFKE